MRDRFIVYLHAQWYVPLVCTLFTVFATIIFFAVDIRLGYPHFDTYQYSASVGPQAEGLRPVLLGVQNFPGFERGGELSLPGIYWFKRSIFSIVPYSLRGDQVFSMLCLTGCAASAAVIMNRKGWGAVAIISVFVMILSDPTFVTNVSGTRPEPLAILLLFVGYIMGRSKQFILLYASGLCLGLAATMHVYAALMGPLIGLALLVQYHGNTLPFPFRRGFICLCGILTGWTVLALFWYWHPDAWHLFSTNYGVQRTFHQNPNRFFAYIDSFRLGSGFLVLLLLATWPSLALWRVIRNVRSLREWRDLVVAMTTTLGIPLAYWILKTDQYFYGVFIWSGMIVAFSSWEKIEEPIKKIVALVCCCVALAGMARLAARMKLGYELRDSLSAEQQRHDWLVSRTAGAPRLYFFTREWDIGFKVGVADARLYTFPLPMTHAVVVEFEKQTFRDTPVGAILLYDRDYADTCPFHNRGSFDPREAGDWGLVETKTWYYDFSPAKAPARVWEIWRKKA